jgi:hypothetical protein
MNRILGSAIVGLFLVACGGATGGTGGGAGGGSGGSGGSGGAGGAGTPRTIIGAWNLSTQDPDFATVNYYEVSFKESLAGNSSFGTMALHTDVKYSPDASVRAGCVEKLDYPGTFKSDGGTLTTTFISGGSVNRTMCNDSADNRVAGSTDSAVYSAKFTGAYTATTTAFTINNTVYTPK